MTQKSRSTVTLKLAVSRTMRKPLLHRLFECGDIAFYCEVAHDIADNFATLYDLLGLDSTEGFLGNLEIGNTAWIEAITLNQVASTAGRFRPMTSTPA